MEELHQLGEQAAEIHYKPQSLQDVAFLVTQPVLIEKIDSFHPYGITTD